MHYLVQDAHSDYLLFYRDAFCDYYREKGAWTKNLPPNIDDTFTIEEFHTFDSAGNPIKWWLPEHSEFVDAELLSTFTTPEEYEEWLNNNPELLI